MTAARTLAVLAVLLLGVRPAAAEDAFEESPLEAFLRAMVDIQARYVEESAVDTAKLLADAEDGVMAALDVESLVLPEEDPGGSAEIGLTVGVSGGVVTVLDVVEDSPAARTGIVAGDRLLRIDGESVHVLKRPEVAAALTGQTGSRVWLMWIDAHGFYHEEAVKREAVRRESWRSFVVDGVDVIQVFDLDEASVSALKKKLAAAGAKEGAPGAVVDFRRAARGDIDAALDFAGSCFSGGELLAIGQGAAAGEMKQYVAVKKGEPLTTPMVLLIGEGTRGAAELVAAALKEHRRAVVVGRRSFGYVARQETFRIGEGGKQRVRLTVERFLSPSRVSLSGTGVGAEMEMPRPRRGDVARILAERGVVARLTDRILETPPAAFDSAALDRGDFELNPAVLKGKSVAEQRGEFEQAFEITLEDLLREMLIDLAPEEVAPERLDLISQVRVEIARRRKKPDAAMLVRFHEDEEIRMGIDVLRAMRKLRRPEGE